MDLNNLLGKNVISVYNCEIFGTVNKIYLSSRYKCVYLGITHDNIEYSLSTNHISSISNDCIMIANNTLPIMASNLSRELDNLIPNPYPMVYTSRGIYCGKVKNITFDNKYNMVEIVLDNEDVYTKDKILSMSSDVCILRSSKRDTVSKYKPRQILIDNSKIANIPVKALDTNINNIPSIKPTTIAKVSITDTSMLLNRVVQRRIIAINGEVIARENSKITKDMIRMARINGKLYELIKYSV